MENFSICPSVSNIINLTDSELLTNAIGISSDVAERLCEDGLDILKSNAGCLEEAYELTETDTRKVSDLLAFSNRMDVAKPNMAFYHTPKSVCQLLIDECELGNCDKFILVMEDCACHLIDYIVYDTAFDTIEDLPIAEIIGNCTLHNAYNIYIVNYRVRELAPTFDDVLVNRKLKNLFKPYQIKLRAHIVMNQTQYRIVKEKKEGFAQAKKKNWAVKIARPGTVCAEGATHANDDTTYRGIPKSDQFVGKEAYIGDDGLTDSQLMVKLWGIDDSLADSLGRRGLYRLRNKLEILGKAYKLTPEEEQKIGSTILFAMRMSTAYTVGLTITKPEQVYQLLRSEIIGFQQEKNFIVMLDAKRNLIGYRMTAMGDQKTVSFSISIIVRECLLNNAKRLICVHNHPGGDLRPSKADYGCLHGIQSAIIPMGIQLEYDMILTDNAYKVYNLPEKKVVR